LLNDCKYGHDIQDSAPNGTMMRLSLLRSSTHPDPHADEGMHNFCYSLLPHNGRLGSETIKEAYALNNPPFVFQRGGAEARREHHTEKESFILHPSSLILCRDEIVVIETIKQAEDGNGVIVRLYESLRQRGTITLQTGLPLTAAYRTNLLEENQEALVVEEDRVMVGIRPFQIITLRLIFLSE
jgi:alpha-mannosidase